MPKVRQNETPVLAPDIIRFFESNTRNENDASNKTRERILKILLDKNLPFVNDDVFGEKWRHVRNEWVKAIEKIGDKVSSTGFTSYIVKIKGGMGSHFDALATYYNNDDITAQIKVEFKHGGTNIDELPQFLSLPTKCDIIDSENYAEFYFKNYLDKYLLTDTGLTEKKPTLEEYMKFIGSIKYNCNSFIKQIKEREDINKQEKNLVVNTSISDYLIRNKNKLNLSKFTEKVKGTQNNKIFTLWSNGTFHIDLIDEDEMNVSQILDELKNDNVIQLKSGNTIYGLLLRWRNHKGVLNPCWQISLKRIL